MHARLGDVTQDEDNVKVLEKSNKSTYTVRRCLFARGIKRLSQLKHVVLD